MSTSSRQLRKLVTTRSHITEKQEPEAIEGLKSVMDFVVAGKNEGAGQMEAATAQLSKAISKEVIPGAPDPVRVLNLKPDEVRGTTELHMGRKGLQSIHPNFQHFVNLEILWLNDNELTAVQGLIPAMSAREALMNPSEARSNASKRNEAAAAMSGLAKAAQANPMSSTLLLMQNTAVVANRNHTMSKGASHHKHIKHSGDDTHSQDSDREVGALNAALAVPPNGCRRLKRVYLSNNRIQTIDGDLQKLKYLEILTLANNQLTDMHTVSKKLRHLLFLRQLDLYGNPICEEQGYRYYIIANHPTVEVLDREAVTDAERQLAKAMFGNKQLNYEALTSGRGKVSAMMGGKAFNLSALVEKDSVGSGSVVNGGRGGTSESGDNASVHMSRKEVVMQRTPVGFGCAVPPAIPMRRAEPISASVAVLESRCSMINAEQLAAKRRAKDKEAADLSELAEQRRLFHHLWETSAGAQAANAAKISNEQAMLLDASVVTGRSKATGKGGLNASVGGAGILPVGSATSPSNKGAGGAAGKTQAAQQQQRMEQMQQSAMAEHSRMLAEAAHQRSLAAREKIVSRIYHLDSDKATDQHIVELIELQRREGGGG